MAEYTTTLSQEEIDKYIASIRNSGMYFFPHNKPIWVVVRKSRIVIRGIFAKAKINSSKLNDHGILELTVHYGLPWLISFFILVAILLAALFIENATINGELDPPFIKRLGFVAKFALAWLVPVSIIRALKKDFKRKIIKDLRLTLIKELT